VSSRRFKTIILLMLVVVNVALLAVSVPVYWQNAQRRTALEDGLAALMEAQQVAFDPAILPAEQTLYELELGFSTDRELDVVNRLIPGARADVSSPYQTTWTSGEDSVTVELSGAFRLQLKGLLVTEPLALLEELGFEVADTQRSLRTLTVWQEVNGAKLLTPLKLELSEDRVSGMDGYFLLYEGTPLRISQEAGCSAADALVAFLSNRDALGWVGGAVTALEQGYVPAQNATALQLRPVWRITTDTAVYEVDALTRTVYLVE